MMIGLLVVTALAAGHPDDLPGIAPAAPLENGAELRLGAGAALFFRGSSTLVFPAYVISARYAPDSNLELAFPLIATVSAAVALQPRMRVAASIGIVSFGVDPLRGAFVTPSADASIHVGNRRSMLFAAFGARIGGSRANVGFLGTALVDPSPTAFGRAGWVLTLSDHVTVGLACEASMVVVDLRGEGRGELHLSMGAPFYGPHSTIPAIRYELVSSLYLEGWVWLEAMSLTSPTQASLSLPIASALVSLTWAPRF